MPLLPHPRTPFSATQTHRPQPGPAGTHSSSWSKALSGVPRPSYPQTFMWVLSGVPVLRTALLPPTSLPTALWSCTDRSCPPLQLSHLRTWGLITLLTRRTAPGEQALLSPLPPSDLAGRDSPWPHLYHEVRPQGGGYRSVVWMKG